MIKHFCAILAIAALLSGCAAPSPSFFNGSDLAGWELVTVPAVPLADAVRVAPGGIIQIKGEPVGYLASSASYTDYRLQFEWRWTAKPGNGGVLLHIGSGPRDRAWPLSIQVQTKNGSVGDVLPMAGASFSEPLTSAAGAAPQIKARTGADSEQPVGQWNTCEVLSRAGTIAVRINGAPQNTISGAMPNTGRVGFQLEGTPYELRALRLTPL